MIRHITVIGVPAPKGSSRAVLRGGRAINIPSGSDTNKAKQQSWKSDVRDAAAEWRDHGQLEGPVIAAILYRFAMRGGDLAKGKDGVVFGPKADAPLYLATKPDCDKLDRSTLDAITSAGGIWADDAQVAVKMSGRIYAPPGHWLGAEILLGGIDELQEINIKWRGAIRDAAIALQQAKMHTVENRDAARAARRRTAA